MNKIIKQVLNLATCGAILSLLNCNSDSLPTSPAESLPTGIISDCEGNSYRTITIGTQTWTIDNLRSTKYNDGTPIEMIQNASTWDSCQYRHTGAYCYHNKVSTPDMKSKYGALYNWYAVHTGKLAPSGWHVPSDSDWTILANFLANNGFNYDSSKYNEFAKSIAATADWQISSEPGSIGNNISKNNKTGFSALPGGSRDEDGSFDTWFYQRGEWWTSTGYDSLNAKERRLYFNDPGMSSGYRSKLQGFSIRLMKD